MLATRYYFCDEFSRFEDIFSQYKHENVEFKKSASLAETMDICHYNYLVPVGQSMAGKPLCGVQPYLHCSFAGRHLRSYVTEAIGGGE